MLDERDILKKLQKGYEDKIPENAISLVSEIFSSRQDILILGTGSWEVCLGREEVIKLIHDDWDAWGDYKINIDGAIIETVDDTSWFYTDCTVRYSFTDSDDSEFTRIGGWVKKIVENQNATAKQRLSFLNWAMSLLYHQRKPDKREYLWPSELSGMLVKENGAWKIASLHFSIVKPVHPDERFEETFADYRNGHIHTRSKILEHNGNKVDNDLLNLLTHLEREMIDDFEYGGLNFDLEQTLMFDSGRFSWIMALGASKHSISESTILDRSIQEILALFNSDLSPEDTMFQVKRKIAYTLRETSSGTEFTRPIRLTAIVEKGKKGYAFRTKHFSYPFYWIFEGKL
jgi:hypothetical protein